MSNERYGKKFRVIKYENVKIMIEKMFILGHALSEFAYLFNIILVAFVIAIFLLCKEQHLRWE